MKTKDKIIIRAIALCYKPYLKPEEAMIYCNLQQTQLAKRCNEHGVYKIASEYYKKEELDHMLSRAISFIEEKANQINIKFR